jgi:hypothetical protein
VLAGEPAGGTRRWTEATTIGCDEPSRLYCLDGLAASLFANEPAGTSIIYVTQMFIQGNSGVAAADALCEMEGVMGGLPNPSFKALITPGGGKTVKEKFDGIVFTNDPVRRRDGIRVAANAAAMLDGAPFEASPNVSSMGAYIDVDAWIGAGGFNSFEADCAGWTSNVGFGATRSVATTRDSTFFQQTACNQPRNVLCINAVIAQAKPEAGTRQPQATRTKR